MKTNFSPICIFVSYKSNRIGINVPVNGMQVREVLRISCAQLGLNARDYNVTRHGNILKPDELLFPFSDVALSPHEQTQQPTLQTHLWHITGQVLQEEALRIVARETYEECTNYMRRLAHLGLWEARILLPANPQGEADVPPSWVRFVRHFDPHHQTRVFKYLKQLFHQDGLYPVLNDDVWMVTWKKDSKETIHVRLTARDLVQMGYNPANGDLFNRIMYALRGAIIDGQVHPESVEAQKDWVREHYFT